MGVHQPIISILIVLIFFVLIRIRTNLLNITVNRSIAIREKIGQLLNVPTISANEEEQSTSQISEKLEGS